MISFSGRRQWEHCSAELEVAEGVADRARRISSGKVRAYKLVTADGIGPYNGGIRYEVGETYEVKDADCDPENDCGAGINLATLPWCIQSWSPGHRILLAEFSARDIAAIPASDGKFRVHKAKIVRELDLVEIGLVGRDTESGEEG